MAKIKIGKVIKSGNKTLFEFARLENPIFIFTPKTISMIVPAALGRPHMPKRLKNLAILGDVLV
jgi:hypothetical protein